MPLSEAAIVAYEEKLNIFKMPQSRIFTCMVLASFVPNFMHLPYLGQVSHVSAVLAGEVMFF